MSLSRRDLMRALGAAGVTASFGRSFAQTSTIDPNRQFLFLYFSGGWDQTQCFDPRDPAQFPDALKATTGIELAWGDLPVGLGRAVVRPTGSNIAFGPSIGRLREHFDQMCVVRGMSMETLTHQVGMRRFLTGKAPAGQNARGSSTGAMVAEQLAAARPDKLGQIPNLVFDVEAYYEGATPAARPFRASIDSTYSLTAAFTRGLAGYFGDLALAKLTAPPSLLAGYRAAQRCDPVPDPRGVRLSVRQAQARNDEMFASGLAREFDLGHPANTPDVLRYGAFPGTPGAAAFIARQALRTGVSNCVTVQMQDELDTHASNHGTFHATRLVEAFDKVALLMEDLRTLSHPAGGKLIDHTTVLLFSEFTRTALLNPARGRDHSLTNCCALLGAGVPHNRVVGASSDVGMEPQPVRRSDGQVALNDMDAVVLRPDHVLASMLRGAGYDPGSVREPVPCLMQTA
ncbi:MAG: DUF1501 domain-containing protein [Myxococcaceae bacterium]|nr:DUF1501 domain-containing protein [Myxococcaceae bacterium]